LKEIKKTCHFVDLKLPDEVFLKYNTQVHVGPIKMKEVVMKKYLLIIGLLVVSVLSANSDTGGWRERKRGCPSTPEGTSQWRYSKSPRDRTDSTTVDPALCRRYYRVTDEAIREPRI
jgi:hypothetical protein